MNHKRILSITEARKKIFKIADEVQKPDTHYMLTDKGKPKAVILSVDEYESWIETLEVNAQFPNLDDDFKQGWEDVKRGETVELDDVLREHGYELKPLLSNEVSGRSNKKRHKKS